MDRLVRRFLVVGITVFALSASYCQNLRNTEIEEILVWSKQNANLDLETAFDTLSYAVDECLAKGDDRSLAEVYTVLGRMMVDKFKSFEQAREYAEKIHDLGVKTNDPEILAKYHNTLGEYYHFEHINVELAFAEFEKSRSILLENQLPLSAGLLNNYGLHYLTDNKADSALLYMKRARARFVDVDSHHEAGFLITNALNTGVCYIYLGKPDSAEYCFQNGVELANADGTESDRIGTYTYLGIYYQENNRIDEALSTLKKGEELISWQASFGTKALLYEGISLCHESLGNYKAAYHYKALQNKYNDSIQLTGLKEQAFANQYITKLDSVEHEKAILLLENQVNEQRRISNEQEYRSRITLIVASGCVVILLLIFVLYRINKSRKFNLITAENERLEKEQFQKTSEIEILKKENALMVASAEISIRKNEMNSIKSKLEEHIDSSPDPEFDNLRKFLNKIKHAEKNQDQLVHIDAMLDYSNGPFFKVIREKHPNLTSDDIRLCALLRLNITPGDLAQIFNISISSIRTKKYRLKKKLKLDGEASVENYLVSL
ncbi:MAG: hypothetical protein P8M05_03405 [Flavobacteriales bacterium]|nr:hypothetical protein [Flavobacteriales bacterium]